LSITRTKTPKEKTPNEKLVFGRYFSDHMLEVDWDEKHGWGKPVISPYHKLELDPSASVLHYAIEVRLNFINELEFTFFFA
jgi:branched-chain amino acid aminotransferase